MAPSPDSFSIANARVFDGEHVTSATTIVVADGVIAAIGPQLDPPRDRVVIDGTGKTVLPGLIDAHVHIYDGAQLERALAFGVTTVLDMGSWPPRIGPIRVAAGAGHADVRIAGVMATAPGGHGTQFGLPIPTISGPDAAAAFVDARIAEGSDYIKIVYDDGSGFDRSIPTLSVETIRALVAAAHGRGRLAIAHIGDADEARVAVECGVDSIAHLFRDRAPDADFGARCATGRVFVTATLAVLRTPGDPPHRLADDPDLAPYLGADARETLAEQFAFHPRTSPGAIEATIAQLRAAGVPILCGTDAPNPGTAHGASMHDELALLVAAGLSPIEALIAATAAPARAFGLIDRGAIVAGRRADLVIVDGDPTTTITDSRRISAIWRGGVRFDRAAYAKREGARPEPPPEVRYGCGCGSSHEG